MEIRTLKFQRLWGADFCCFAKFAPLLLNLSKIRKIEGVLMNQWFTKISIALILINMLLSGWFIIYYWAQNQVTISATFIKIWFIVWAVVACLMIIKFAFVKYKPQITKQLKKVDKEDVKEVLSDVKDILE